MALYKGNVKLAGIGVSNGIVTSATAPVSPIEGMVWYDTTNDQLKVYDGTNWNVTGKEYVQGNGINISNDTVSVDTTVVATQTDLDSKQDTLVSGTNIKTINGETVLGSGDIDVQDTLVSGTNIKTINSTSLLGSGNIDVQDTLVSGTNIKTINGESVLGSGDLEIKGGGCYVDIVAVGGGAGNSNFNAGTTGWMSSPGGGGGVNLKDKYQLSSNTTTVTIGAGGPGGCSYNTTLGQGGDSIFDGAIVGYGGGNAVSGAYTRATGGPSTNKPYTQYGASPTLPGENSGRYCQGYWGGSSVCISDTQWATGGAGGAGGPGGPVCASNNNWACSCIYGGRGGNGIWSPLTDRIYGVGGDGVGLGAGGQGATCWGDCGSGARGCRNATAVDGCPGVIEVGYPIDGSYGFNCATGGEISLGEKAGKVYKVHTFTDNGNFEICGTCEIKPFVRVALVGGGSGASNQQYNGGGGGGGELVICETKELTECSNSVVVGAGGEVGVCGCAGGYSCAFGICAKGGYAQTSPYCGATSGNGCSGGLCCYRAGGGGGGAISNGGDARCCYGGAPGAGKRIVQYTGLNYTVAGQGGYGGGCCCSCRPTNPYFNCYCFPGNGGINGSNVNYQGYFYPGTQGMVAISYAKDGSTGIHCATGGDCCLCDGTWCYHIFINNGTFCVVC